MKTPMENQVVNTQDTNSQALAKAIRQFGGRPRENSAFRGVFAWIASLGAHAIVAAVVIAAAATGAAINVHPGRDPDQPQEVADFIRAAGHSTERVVISHIDRTIFDEARLLKLTDSGVTIEFDLFGQAASYYGLSDIDMPNDATRLKLIRALISHGHLERVVISHDICYRTRLASFGGHGYGHIFRNVVPMMKKRGYSETEIDTILVDNPRRLLTFV